MGLGYLVAITLSAVAAGYWLLIPSASTAVDEFLQFSERSVDGVEEDELMDPLIAARGDVLPAVIKAIPFMAMPMQAYAVTFLGNQGDRRSLALLHQLLGSEAENAALRSDALQSIARVDPQEGRRLALLYRDRADAIGFMANQVLKGALLEKRPRGLAIRNVISERLTRR